MKICARVSCGKRIPFTRHNNRKYCSDQCCNKVHYDKRDHKKPKREGITKCKFCDKLFPNNYYGPHLKYCSRTCKDKFNSRRSNLRRKSSKSLLEKECKMCGAKFTTGRTKRLICNSPDCLKSYQRYQNKMLSKKLSDCYIRAIINNNTNTKAGVITPEMIEEKRLQLKLNRLINEKQRTIESQRGNGGSIVVLPRVDPDGSLPPQHAKHHKPRKGSRPNRNGNAS